MEQELVTTTSEYDRYRGFSCPHEAIDEDFMRRIAATHYRRALRTFVARHGVFLRETGSGVVDLFERWLAEDASSRDFETMWHVAFGKMREVLAQRMGDDEVALSGARVGLRLAEMGREGRFSVKLASPERLRFGRYVLPMGQRIEIAAERDALEATIDHGGERSVLRFERDGEWRQESGPAAFAIPTFDTGARTINLLVPETPEGRDNMEHELVADDEVLATIRSGYRSAFDVLARFAPVYAPFVNRLLRNLVPVQPEPGGYIGGGSLRDNPGVVKLPFAREPVGLAANLGHENAHQHYFLARSAGRIDDGSDTALYYSPFVFADRDLTSIVLTYHAFANEALVLRTCELAGIDDPYAGERAILLRDTLAPLEDLLAKSKALTPMGHAIWEPVATRLAQSFR
ncbi:MAG: hypothetical protein KF819_25485 [Labilithrix sp.]|nr:hypothetical protein [Labilithrix sp.]